MSRQTSQILSQSTRASLVLIATFAACSLGMLGGCPQAVPSATTDPAPINSPGDAAPPSPQPNNTPEPLSEGVHDVTLQAAEAKRFQLSLDAGQTAIINAVMPDSTTDVDLFAYAPGEQWPLAESMNGPGLPDNLAFIAPKTGDYSVEIVNVLSDQVAQCMLSVQRIESDTASTSLLNGVYELTEASDPTWIGQTWVFSDGELVSVFDWLEAGEYGLSEDLHYWIDARSGAATELHHPDVQWSGTIVAAETEQVGFSVSGTIEVRVAVRRSGEAARHYHNDYTYEGRISEDGCILCGTLVMQATVEGESPHTYFASGRLEKCPSSEQPCQVDSDSDGVPDDQDGCPDDPLKVSPGTCGCGTPDVDTDGDGTPDCEDGCPEDPDKVAPGECGCGNEETPGCATWLEEAKLIAADSTAGSGFSVACSGNTAVIGAYRDDDNGENSGAAYVFRFNGSSWVQEAKLLADDGAQRDFFGYSVSVSGDTAVIGALQDDYNGENPGSAYVFRFNGSTWVQQAKLLANDGAPGDLFGESVSVSGNTAVIGAIQDDDNGENSGSAYIFRFNGSTWVQQAKLLASDGSAGDLFGDSVSTFGNTVVVGAVYDGSAYVFRFNGSSWAQEAKLSPFDGAGYFGGSVSVSGDTVAVGASGGDPFGDEAGSAYLFRFNGSTWAQEAKLLADDGAAGDLFGWSVAVSGDVVVIGADFDDDNGVDSGSAYVFWFDGSTWVQQAKLLAHDGAGGDYFGASVAVSGDTVVIAAPLDNDNGSECGSAYVFTRK